MEYKSKNFTGGGRKLFMGAFMGISLLTSPIITNVNNQQDKITNVLEDRNCKLYQKNMKWRVDSVAQHKYWIEATQKAHVHWEALKKKYGVEGIVKCTEEFNKNSPVKIHMKKKWDKEGTWRYNEYYSSYEKPILALIFFLAFWYGAGKAF